MTRILVVEDTPDNRQILHDLLTSAGYEVIEAINGAEGVAAAIEHLPDLILMDIHRCWMATRRRVGSRRTPRRRTPRSLR